MKCRIKSDESGYFIGFFGVTANFDGTLENAIVFEDFQEAEETARWFFHGQSYIIENIDNQIQPQEQRK